MTASAVCHLANEYGQMFITLYIAIKDFGPTNFYQTVQKVTLIVLLGDIESFYIIAGSIISFSIFILAISAFQLAFSNLNSIPTSSVYEIGSTKNLKPRIPCSTDVVVVNSRNKIIMSS